MSVPEKPYTRKEAYLNAAATGDTSGIPERPYTREEMYLDAIAKNGGGGGGGSSTLSGLTDVDISNPTNGQTLVYNATSGKWENGAGSGGVLVGTMPVDDPFALDLTWREINDAAFVVFRDPPDAPFPSGAVFYVSGCYYQSGEGVYYVRLTVLTSQMPELVFRANSPDDYPVQIEDTP